MTELGGSGLAGVRHLHDEREKRRRPRTTTSNRPRTFAGGPGTFSHPRNTTTTVKGGPLPRAPGVSLRQRRRVEDTHAYLCERVDPVMGSLILALMEIRPDDIHEAALDHLLSKRAADESASAEDGQTRTSRTTANSTAGPASANKIKAGVGGGVRAASTTAGGGAVAQQQRLARRQDRLFMAREIGPLITELIRRTLRCMPTDVECFLVEQLQGGTIAPRRRSTATADSHAEHYGSSYRRSNPHLPAPEGTATVATDNSSKDRLHNNNHQHPTRPSTARNRLQQAQSLDNHVQQTSPPLSGRTTEARRSPSPPRDPINGGLSDDEDDGCTYGEDGPRKEASLSSSRGDGGGRAVAHGVRESQNKPWDVEVST